jgi:hypothetical protein
MKSSIRNLKRIIELACKPGRFESMCASRILFHASMLGPATTIIAKIKWASSLHLAESAINSFLRLSRRIAPERLEAACERVLFYGFDSIDMVKTVLMQRLDSLPLDPKTDIWGQPELF